MDTRDTVSKEQGFVQILEQHYRAKQPVSLLYDDNGITRGSGLITDIFGENGANYLRLDTGNVVPVSRVVAVNGIFADDYSEC
jgi:hypothetical protein